MTPRSSVRFRPLTPNDCSRGETDHHTRLRTWRCKFDSCRSDFSRFKPLDAPRDSTVQATEFKSCIFNFELLTMNFSPAAVPQPGRGGRLRPGLVQVRILPAAFHTRPRGEIGRRGGLKPRCPRTSWFESRRGHDSEAWYPNGQRTSAQTRCVVGSNPTRAI